MFDVLFPPGDPAAADDLLAVPDGRCVLVNMVQTLDGHVTREGGSTQLGGAGDKALFFALRGIVDGVLAGTGTLAAERYGRLIAQPERRAARAARGLAEDATMLLITRSGDVPWEAPLFDCPEQPVLIAGPARVPPRVRARVEALDVDPTDLVAVLTAFADRGVERVLCEGGPRLNGSMVAAGVVDELFFTLDPSLLGGEGKRLIDGAALDPPAGAQLRWVLRHGGELHLRYAL